MRPPVADIAAPPFPAKLEWVNVAMLRMDKQRGRPVLIEFFDFCRVNSLRTLPYVKAWHERYAAAGSAIGWLLLGQVFAGMYLMVTNYLFYARRTGLLSTVTVVSGALQVALLLVLAPRLGIQGAAMAFSIAMAVRFVLTWWAAHKSHPMPWFSPVGGMTGTRAP